MIEARGRYLMVDERGGQDGLMKKAGARTPAFHVSATALQALRK